MGYVKKSLGIGSKPRAERLIDREETSVTSTHQHMRGQSV